MSTETLEVGDILEKQDMESSAYAIVSICYEKFCMEEGNYVSRSQYSSIDEAIKWVKGYFKGASESLYAFSKESALEGRYTNYGELYRELDIIEKNYPDIAQKLETKLENKIDNKIKENSGTRRLMQRFRENNTDVYGVDLKETLTEVFKELDLPLRMLNSINTCSRVAPDYFLGINSLNSRVIIHRFLCLCQRR